VLVHTRHATLYNGLMRSLRPDVEDYTIQVTEVPSLVWWKLVDSALRQFSTLEDHAARSIG
jgi:hypothetical protein